MKRVCGTDYFIYEEYIYLKCKVKKKIRTRTTRLIYFSSLSCLVTWISNNRTTPTTLGLTNFCFLLPEFLFFADFLPHPFHTLQLQGTLIFQESSRVMLGAHNYQHLLKVARTRAYVVFSSQPNFPSLLPSVLLRPDLKFHKKSLVYYSVTSSKMP